MPNKTNTVIGFTLFRRRQPKYIGDEVEAIVPTADTIPAPIPLALEGYNSQKYTWKKQKKNATAALKMNTITS